MFRTPFASIIRNTINCNSSLYSCIAVKVGVHCTIPIDSYTGFIPSQFMTNTSGCCYSL